MGEPDANTTLHRQAQAAPPPDRTYLTGTQALVRAMLAQAEADRTAGLHTAGFVSGYRGSPLGAVDQELWRAKDQLAAAGVRFQPGVNEDLAAVSVLGTQKVESDPERTVDGVFAMWYGKGPGVDRSGDALRHGHAYGASPHGGVLVVAGDDHGCVSSSMSHQSDNVLAAWSMPVIHPASIADYVPFALWGWAASRTSGAWIGFKAISETVEGAASVPTPTPTSFTAPKVDSGPDGLHWRWPDLPGPQIERRLPHKLRAVEAFARANPIDHVVVPVARPRLVVAAVGKAFGDVMEVLAVAGLEPGALAASGIAVVKVGLVFPLSPVLAELAETADEVLVVEEKAAVVETLLRTHLFNRDRRPRVIGKTDAAGAPLLPAESELRPSRVAPILANRLAAFGLTLHLPRAWCDAPLALPGNLPVRTPYFCSGCPHNTSTQVPDGSRAQSGIGCHFMAGWMDRGTAGIVPMGAEGADWIGQAPFVRTPHIFQNLGDGTFFHSGLLAIRASIAANSHVTYKLLFNDAVAMTGGQPVDGTMTVAQITHVARAEGVARIAVVADDPAKYGPNPRFAPGVTLRGRDALDAVQRELREVPGTTLLVYDQVCATEARRRRKRDKAPPPQRRVVINDLVCEGCGDCQKASNCLSVVPVETEWGRKRTIDQSSCNSDLSCLAGFCPSFVTVEGGTPKRAAGAGVPAAAVLARAAALPEPAGELGDRPFEVLVAGVGGTGVVTVGALLTSATHLSGGGATVLDFTGFAQKGGQVLSHVRLARDPGQLHQVRIDRGRADVLIAADLVVAAGPEAMGALDPGRTRVVANSRETQTGTTLRNPDARIETGMLEALLRRRAGEYASLDATALAERLLGDTIAANVLLLGFAWQKGMLPLPLSALHRAMEASRTAVEGNKLAFAWGRLLAADPAFVAPLVAAPDLSQTLDEVVARRTRFLAEYANAAYAERYRTRVETVRRRESDLNGGTKLTEAVARNLFRLMAIKDEYEVARLHAATGFADQVRAGFEGKPRLRFHLAPPLLARPGPDGRPRKLSFGSWMLPVFHVLARLKPLRGTPLDPFGWTAERRAERALLADYEATLDSLLPTLDPAHLPLALEWATLPATIRGFGHVKAAAMQNAAIRRSELLAQLNAPLAAAA